MSIQTSHVEGLRRLFNDGFSVRDIAQPLMSFDDSTPAQEVKAFMENRRLEIVGVRRHGLVAGYVELGDLAASTGGRCGDCVREFDEFLVVSDAISFANLVLRLKDRRRLFVTLLDHVGGIVSRSDLQKPAARMWLFGMVTLIEMRLTRMIEQRFEDDSWKPFLSEARLKKAGELLAERTRRNQQLRLLDCLQFSDKGQIVARCEELRRRTLFESRRQVEFAVKRIERLRNNLAHAQDIVTHDWDTIVDLSENLDRVLEEPATRREHDA